MRQIKASCQRVCGVSFAALVFFYLTAFLPRPAALLGNVDRWLTHTEGSGQTLPAKNMGNEIYYQVFVDRFANGNPRNDCFYDGRFCDPLKQDWYRYWGGDIRGVIDRMPYLKHLGITRLWLTPIFENQQVMIQRGRYGRNIEMSSYHGYWMRDWFQLNPMFTDYGKRDYVLVDELIAAGAPQIKMILDTIVNHTSPSDPTGASVDYLNRIEPLGLAEDGQQRSHIGALFQGGSYLTSLPEDWRRSSDPRFHRFGTIGNVNSTFEMENYQLDGLSDIDQNSPLMANYMRDAHRFWLDRFPQLAGYRMDTIKHVGQDYWRAFDRDFYTRYPNLEIVGEYYGAGPYNHGSQDFYRQTHMSMFDFDFRHALENVFLHNGSMSEFSRLWERDYLLTDARPMVTFIDNHDMPRLRGQGMSYAAMRQALVLLFAARGIPCVYYGLEQDLFVRSDPGDPYNRPMMTSFDESSEFFQLTARLARLRKENLALRYGATHIVHESNDILAFERVLGEQRVFFATSKNPISGSDDFAIENLSLPDGRYQDLLTGRVYEVRAGVIPVSLRRGDIILLSSTRSSLVQRTP